MQIHSSQRSPIPSLTAPRYTIRSKSHSFFLLHLLPQLGFSSRVFHIPQPLPPSFLLQFSEGIESLALGILEGILLPASPIRERCASGPVVQYIVRFVERWICERIRRWWYTGRAFCGHGLWAGVWTWAKESVAAIGRAGKMSGCSAGISAIEAREDRRRVAYMCSLRGWDVIVRVWIERLKRRTLVNVTVPPLPALDEDEAGN